MREECGVEGALHATRAAVEEGIVPGGGVALLRCKDAIAKIKTDNEDQAAGVKIVLRAIEQLMGDIARNAGDEPSVVIAKGPRGQVQLRLQRPDGRVRRHGGDGRAGPDEGHALRAAERRIRLRVDPHHRRDVVELPKDEKSSAGMPGGGGMGGMGDTDM